MLALLVSRDILDLWLCLGFLWVSIVYHIGPMLPFVVLCQTNQMRGARHRGLHVFNFRAKCRSESKNVNYVSKLIDIYEVAFDTLARVPSCPSSSVCGHTKSKKSPPL
jgi:hypothetical protein